MGSDRPERRRHLLVDMGTRVRAAELGLTPALRKLCGKNPVKSIAWSRWAVGKWFSFQ